MATDTLTTDQLALAEIRALVEKFSAVERRLIDRMAEAYASGVDKGMPMSERELQQRGRDRAEQILDGDPVNENHEDAAASPPKRRGLSGKLLPPAKLDAPNSGIRGLYVEREAVRQILEGLARQSLAAETADAVHRAAVAEPRWRDLEREWLLAAARFEAVNNAALEFQYRLGPLACRALPESHVPVSDGEISFPTNIWSPFQTITDIIEEAIKRGLVSRSEIAAARRVR